MDKSIAAEPAVMAPAEVIGDSVMLKNDVESGLGIPTERMRAEGP